MQPPSTEFFVTLNTSLAQVAAANCDCCRKSHMKCDRLLPICSNCRARQRDCIYSNKRSTASRKSKAADQDIGSSKKKRKMSAEEQTMDSNNVQKEMDNQTQFLEAIAKNCQEFFTSTFYEWVGFDVQFPIFLKERLEAVMKAQIEFIKEINSPMEFDKRQTLFGQFEEHQKFMLLNYNMELELSIEQLKHNSDSRISSLLPSVIYLCHQHVRQDFAESLYKNIETKQMHLSELAILLSMESVLCFHLVCVTCFIFKYSFYY